MSEIEDLFQEQTAIFDCRSSDDFKNGHLSRSVNIPAEDLFDRMQELPDKSSSFYIIVDDKCEYRTRQFLKDRSLSLRGIFHWRDVSQLPEKHLEKGYSKIFYWKPAPFIEQCHQNFFLPLLEPGSRIYDLACGSGRDSVYLAMQGWQVSSLDNSETALNRCARTAEYHHVNVQLVQADMEKNFQFDAIPLLASSPDAFIVCRYLHRPLLPLMRDKLKLGGIIAYHTFMKGSEQFGSPKNPNYLLNSGELAAIFDGFDILLDDVKCLSDGRPMSHFVARKI